MTNEPIYQNLLAERRAAKASRAQPPTVHPQLPLRSLPQRIVDVVLRRVR